jgi:hypothetical protein
MRHIRRRDNPVADRAQLSNNLFRGSDGALGDLRKLLNHLNGRLVPGMLKIDRFRHSHWRTDRTSQAGDVWFDGFTAKNNGC